MKKDPEKEILVSNILYPNQNPESGFFLISYEEKIARIAVDSLSDIALEININEILNGPVNLRIKVVIHSTFILCSVLNFRRTL